MAIEKQIILNVDTGNAASSTKELRDNISKLSDSLVNLDERSEEYNKTVSEIKRNQQELTSVQAASSNGLRALRTEINNLRGELVNLQPGTEEYNNVLQRLAESQDKLSAVTITARNTTTDLSRTLGNVARVGAGVAAGFSALNATASLLGIENEDLQKTFVKLQAGMALVQGLQGIAGLTNSIPALVAGLKSLRVVTLQWNAALLLNPITLIILGVAALAAGVVYLTGIFRSNRKELTDLNDSYNELNRTLETANQSREVLVRVMQAEGRTEEEIIEFKRQSIQASIDKTKALIAEYEATEKLDKEQRKNLETLKETLNGYYSQLESITGDELVLQARRRREQKQAEERAIEEAIERQRRAAEERQRIYESELSEIDKINTLIRNNNLSAYDRELNDLRTTYEERLRLFERHGRDTTELTEQYYRDVEAVVIKEENRISGILLDERRKELEEIEQSNQDKLSQNEIYLRELETQLSEYNLRLTEAIGNSDTDAALEATRQIEAVKAQIEIAQNEIAENNILFLDEYRENLELLLSEEWLTAEQRIEIEREIQETSNQIALDGLAYRQSLIDREIKSLQDQQKKEKEITDLKRKVQESYLSSASSILGDLSSIIGEETAAGKSAAVASATIETYSAANKAYSSLAAIPIVGPGLGAAAAAAAIVSGIANVKKILSVKVDGASDSTASISADVPVPVPQVEDYYEPDIQATSNILTSTEEQDLRQNNRVYVVESDIADTANRVQVSQAERLGYI